MANLVSSWPKDYATLEIVEGKRTLMMKKSDIFPDEPCIIEDEHHHIYDRGDRWEVSIGPVPCTVYYETWEDVPDEEKWWYEEFPQKVVFFDGPISQYLTGLCS